MLKISLVIFVYLSSTFLFHCSQREKDVRRSSRLKDSENDSGMKGKYREFFVRKYSRNANSNIKKSIDKEKKRILIKDLSDFLNEDIKDLKKNKFRKVESDGCPGDENIASTINTIRKGKPKCTTNAYPKCYGFKKRKRKSPLVSRNNSVEEEKPSTSCVIISEALFNAAQEYVTKTTDKTLGTYILPLKKRKSCFSLDYPNNTSVISDAVKCEKPKESAPLSNSYNVTTLPIKKRPVNINIDKEQQVNIIHISSVDEPKKQADKQKHLNIEKNEIKNPHVHEIHNENDSISIEEISDNTNSNETERNSIDLSTVRFGNETTTSTATTSNSSYEYPDYKKLLNSEIPQYKANIASSPTVISSTSLFEHESVKKSKWFKMMINIWETSHLNHSIKGFKYLKQFEKLLNTLDISNIKSKLRKDSVTHSLKKLYLNIENGIWYFPPIHYINDPYQIIETAEFSQSLIILHFLFNNTNYKHQRYNFKSVFESQKHNYEVFIKTNKEYLSMAHPKNLTLNFFVRFKINSYILTSLCSVLSVIFFYVETNQSDEINKYQDYFKVIQNFENRLCEIWPHLTKYTTMYNKLDIATEDPSEVIQGFHKLLNDLNNLSKEIDSTMNEIRIKIQEKLPTPDIFCGYFFKFFGSIMMLYLSLYSKPNYEVALTLENLENLFSILEKIMGKNLDESISDPNFLFEDNTHMNSIYIYLFISMGQLNLLRYFVWKLRTHITNFLKEASDLSPNDSEVKTALIKKKIFNLFELMYSDLSMGTVLSEELKKNETYSVRILNVQTLKKNINNIWDKLNALVIVSKVKELLPNEYDYFCHLFNTMIKFYKKYIDLLEEF